VKHYDVIIVGGGLAGLTAALHLRKEGHSILVVEKKEYPHHKVCGEYVSNEVLPYLKQLGISLHKLGAVAINTLQLSTFSGDSVSNRLPLGGTGISRYAFDNSLFEKATALGVDFTFQGVTGIQFEKEVFEVTTDKKESFIATLVIGAYGKRSDLDKKLKRDFIRQKSSWLGVKAHYKYEGFPKNLVALHNFKGGYGGLSKTETGAINFCYLANYASFQKERNIENFNRNVVAQNPFLASFLERAEPLFEEPLTIAQISFDSKKALEDHVVMCGDTAGLIHPLCGNGMAMAIHSAKIASEHIDKFLSGKNYGRGRLEVDYQNEWNKMFRRRLWIGRKLQSVLMNETLSNIALNTAVKSPRILRSIIERTHGNPIEV